MKLPELPPDTSPAVREAFETLARESTDLRAEVDALKRTLAGRLVVPAAAVASRAPSAAQVATPATPAQLPPADRRREIAADPVGVPPTIGARPTAHVDMEQLLGRYGAWAAATLMILLGVGTLLEWAIRNGLFGPAARVALSCVIAIALAAGGYVLRERATRRGESPGFGNACLGLSLGVVDVIAWQIGPHWQMVPTWIALLLADVGAGALVAFGMREGEELLAAVGAAGLYLAPFVTSSGEGSPVVLATYVVLVSIALFRFVEQETWRVTRLVVRGGSIVAILALVSMGEPVLGAMAASALALAILGIDASLATRLWTTAMYLAVAIVATLQASLATRVAWSALLLDTHAAWLASVAILVTMLVTSAFVLRLLTSDDLAGGAGANARPRSLLALAITLLLPVGVVLAAGAALPGDATLDVLWLSEASGVLALAVALLSEAPLAREYFTTGFVLLWMGALVYTSRVVQIPEAILLGTSVVAIWIATVRPDVGIARFAAFASAVCVALVSAVRMYMAESVVISSATLDVVLMLGACIALVVIARAHIDGEGRERTLRTLAAWTASLLLARHLVVLASGAYAAVALTAFYAATGVALIILGGRRNSLGMRRAGLALSLYAPLRAVATAADVENTGMRVAVYFVAGAFMLLVAFLYRSRGRDGEPILRDVVTEG